MAEKLTMYISHTELLWMLRQVDGQRINKEKLFRKFNNHGLFSLLPYFDGIESLFDNLADKNAVTKKALRYLSAVANCEIDCHDIPSIDLSYQDLANRCLTPLIEAIKFERFSSLEKGARVCVRSDSAASCVKPGSEGFITEKLSGSSNVRFYSIAGRYGVDLFPMEIPDKDLSVIITHDLLARHESINGIARYFLNDSLLRSMRSRLDAAVFSFVSNLAIDFLVDQGFIKIADAEYISVPSRIFSILAPKLNQTYNDPNLFSSPSLSSPPSERKPHALRLELTTGCDYNRCTFCSEYAELPPVTKPFAEFKAHVDKVASAIGSEKSRIQRLFIGSGNSLGVETDLLLASLNYAGSIFAPQRISLYGRTASILEKSVDELKKLKEAGLGLLYWGLESGSDKVLNYVCKDCSRQDMIAAAKMLAAAGIEVSAMLIPGLGGLKFSEEHIAGTLELLHSIDIKYVTFLSINPADSSLYARKMASEPDNRHLTPDEVNRQIYRLLAGLKPTGLQIGMFTEEVDQVSSNSMRFNYQFTDSNKELLLRDFWN